MIIKASSIYDITPTKLTYSSKENDGVMVYLDFFEFKDLKDVVKEVGIDSLLDEIDDDTIAEYLKDKKHPIDIKIEDVMNNFGSHELLTEIVKQLSEDTLIDYISSDTLKAHMRDITIDELDD